MGPIGAHLPRLFYAGPMTLPTSSPWFWIAVILAPFAQIVSGIYLWRFWQRYQERRRRNDP